jgi:hypothetical protein
MELETVDPADPEDRLGYAVALLRGAEVIAASGHDEGKRFVHPFFLLVCFSLENGLKAYLQYRGVDKSEKIDRPPLAHNLNHLLELAVAAGLALPDGATELIDSLSDSHLNHLFRYPKKAGTVELFSDAFAYVWTDEALAVIARAIGYLPAN